jgi:precorrin-6B methylase 2
MHTRWAIRLLAASVLVLFTAVSGYAQAQAPFEPQSGQAGKDVVWVPTPQPLVEKMLDMAKLTPQDFHMDLGSGDGRTVITAAKRGARSLGIEYNPKMVELSRFNAKQAGVSERATFREADLFETDFSKAQVVTLFLLPSINLRLRPKILDMRPGTRIVANTFTMEDWQADQTEVIGGDCTSWCTAYLWIVPAKVDGTWKMPQGQLTIAQKFQNFTGTLGTMPIGDGKLRGDEISFSAGGVTYSGKVDGTTIRGVASSGGAFTATKG